MGHRRTSALTYLDIETNSYLSTNWNFMKSLWQYSGVPDTIITIPKYKYPVGKFNKLLLSRVKGKRVFDVLFLDCQIRELKRLKQLGIFGDELTIF